MYLEYSYYLVPGYDVLLAVDLYHVADPFLQVPGYDVL
jgi:hypothetical protein